jgi:hypothetical protein
VKLKNHSSLKIENLSLGPFWWSTMVTSAINLGGIQTMRCVIWHFISQAHNSSNIMKKNVVIYNLRTME